MKWGDLRVGDVIVAGQNQDDLFLILEMDVWSETFGRVEFRVLCLTDDHGAPSWIMRLMGDTLETSHRLIRNEEAA